MKKWLYIALVALLILGVVYLANYEVKSAEIAPTQATEQVNAPVVTVSMLDADILFNMVNEERAKAGIKPLVRNEKLDYSAQQKSDDMAKYNYFSHDNPSTGFHGYDYIPRGMCPGYQSENITHSATTDRNKASMDGWMDSPPHRKAILDPDYEYAGVGVNGDYGTMHFCDLE